MSDCPISCHHPRTIDLVATFGRRTNLLARCKQRQFSVDLTLWCDDYQPVWLDRDTNRPSDTLLTPVQGVPGGRLTVHDGSLGVVVFRKFQVASGHIGVSVNKLNHLLKLRYSEQIHLFYSVLKMCSQAGDLAVGRYIHALSVRLGYEGHPFLATHLIGLYASHGRLEEAMRVFAKVTEPDAHNWASIIFAYARNGEPLQALQLYQKMRGTVLKPDTQVFVAALKACASARDLASGKDIHTDFLAIGRGPDVFVETSLVDMYAKCGSIKDARKVFDRLRHKTVVTWTAMIAAYSRQGMGQQALDLYRTMQQEGLTPPDPVTFVCLLQACASVGESALRQGQQLHMQIEDQGLQDDVVVGGSLVNMYSKCNNIRSAWRVFSQLPGKNVVTWNAMIAGFVHKGMGQEALALFDSMCLKGITPAEPVTYVSLLQACAAVGEKALLQGQQLHEFIRKQGLQSDLAVGGSLVNMYAKCGSVERAREVFDRLPSRNVVTWTAMIAGYVRKRMGQEALSLYNAMDQGVRSKVDSVTFVCLLQACALVGEKALEQGKQFHAQVEEGGLQYDAMIGGSLVNMYGKCGCVEDARKVFDKLPHRTVVTWTLMISGYVHQGMGEEALNLHETMQEEGIGPLSSATFVCLLQACAVIGIAALLDGKQLHAQIKEQGLQDNVVVGGSLVNMYAKCGSLDDARRVFDRLPQRNVVTWNAMFAGYAQQGMGQEALTLYGSMQQEEPSIGTFVSLLQACAAVGGAALHQGELLHRQIEERGLQVHVDIGGSLVNMYAKCGTTQDARRVFDKLPVRNAVTWTAMIAGYVLHGMGEEAINLFGRMQCENIVPPDAALYGCLLQACGKVVAFPFGKQLHAQIAEQGLQADVVVGTNLLCMYAKCGAMSEAKHVFDSLPERTVEAWTSLISGYACQGDAEAVFHSVYKMRQEGIQPNAITFLCVLTVCSHGGLVGKGVMYFETMTTQYGIIPAIEHCVCMVDLFGRAGYLDQALGMAKATPYEPNGVVWRTLLGACRKWGNVVVGRLAFDHAVQMDDTDPSPYILMSSIYAGARMWDKAKELRTRSMESQVREQPGKSWCTDMSGVVHTFGAGNWNFSDSVCVELQSLFHKMEKEGISLVDTQQA